MTFDGVLVASRAAPNNTAGLDSPSLRPMVKPHFAVELWTGLEVGALDSVKVTTGGFPKAALRSKF